MDGNEAMRASITSVEMTEDGGAILATLHLQPGYGKQLRLMDGVVLRIRDGEGQERLRTRTEVRKITVDQNQYLHVVVCLSKQYVALIFAGQLVSIQHVGKDHSAASA